MPALYSPNSKSRFQHFPGTKNMETLETEIPSNDYTQGPKLMKLANARQNARVAENFTKTGRHNQTERHFNPVISMHHFSHTFWFFDFYAVPLRMNFCPISKLNIIHWRWFYVDNPNLAIIDNPITDDLVSFFELISLWCYTVLPRKTLNQLSPQNAEEDRVYIQGVSK